MIIKHHKKLFFLFSTFVVVIFLSFFANKALALEVKYPIIPGDVNLNTATSVALPDYVKYLFDAGMFIGFFAVFISITVSGVYYLLSSTYPSSEFLAKAKDRFSGAISGLLILVTIYLIITTINPQLAILGSKSLPATPPPQNQKNPGIYFYQSTDCTGSQVLPSQTNISDLGDFKNKVNSISVVQDPDNDIYYAGVLYGNLNFSGKCIYILPNPDSTRTNPDCQPVPSFGLSASVYTYDTDPNGDGVYFYRKPYFDSTGGYFKVTNSDITNGDDVYQKNLQDLTFTDPALVSADNPDGCTVPKEDQDCVEYKDDGSCSKSQCPTLAGKNISSIYIHGNYLVLLVYVGSQDPSISTAGPWTNCQVFPAPGDANGMGPTQLKWQPAMTNLSGLPNAVIILPIQE